MWEDFADAVATCAEGCYVKVQGQISKYHGKFQITLAEACAPPPRREIDPADFVPDDPVRNRRDVGRAARLRRAVHQSRSARAWSSLPRRPANRRSLQDAPAAKRLHHAWLGGLLEHVVTLVRVCRATVPFYPEVDPDLLVTGAILHDIGKVREL